VREAVCLAYGPGKLKSQGVVAACSPGKSHVSPGGLFFITDNASGKKLLVDTGSAYSILPYKSHRRPLGPPLRAAAGQRIRCWGSCSRELLLSGVKYTWSFLQADVSFPILGVDFLQEHQLVVDVCGGALIPHASVLAVADCGLFAVFQPPHQ
jgi:hypothetical protein